MKDSIDAPVQISAGPFSLELRNEPTYTLGSVDNLRSYDAEHVFGSKNQITSRHGLRCLQDSRVRSTAIFLAGGGCSGVHAHSMVADGSTLYLAIGDHVARLALPTLQLSWATRADDATVFGLHLVPGAGDCFVHGELEISRLSQDGRILWSNSGADIFTGDFHLEHGRPHVVDFTGREYCFDPETGTQTAA